MYSHGLLAKRVLVVAHRERIVIAMSKNKSKFFMKFKGMDSEDNTS